MDELSKNSSNWQRQRKSNHNLFMEKEFHNVSFEDNRRNSRFRRLQNEVDPFQNFLKSLIRFVNLQVRLAKQEFQVKTSNYDCLLSLFKCNFYGILCSDV